MDSEKQKILITSALPYANGPLHFGHIAGAYLPADAYARFQRLKKRDVLYVCGSDEYGVAITLSADMAGRTPQEHVDIYHQVIKDLFDKINISFDHYSRTTSKYHQEPVYSYFKDLIANGFIEERVTDQLYSEKDDRFLADRYVVGQCPRCGFEEARGDECQKCGASYDAVDLKNPRSKITNAPLIKRPTKHWFLLLDKFKERLLEWLEVKNWKPNVVNFIREYIKGLHPRAITRDSTWGVPVPLPDSEGKVLYVWFDAPIGYISSTQEWAAQTGSPERWKEYWCDPATKLVQFIGKDNIPFHAAIFPAMTMGQNSPLKLVDELPANEFYNLEGRQFSKSDGWSIDLDDFFTKFTADQIRYTIASNAPETQDSEFTWKDFQARCNAELLGKYGNLVNRVFVFAAKNCGADSPEKGALEEIDSSFLHKIGELFDEAGEAFETFKLRRASQLLMEIAQQGNVYFDSKHPWKDAKAPETLGRMHTTIACCLECLKMLAFASYPIIPETAEKVWAFLGYDRPLKEYSWEDVPALPLPKKTKAVEVQVLFQKVEDAQIEAELQKMKVMFEEAKGKKEKTYEPLKKEVDVEEFKHLDLRIGKVISAKSVPKSKKLLELSIDIGFETRTIVSGISQHYQAEQLVGKSVVVVANLKPVELMGVTSQGMILLGGFDTQMELLETETLPPGSVVR